MMTGASAQSAWLSKAESLYLSGNTDSALVLLQVFIRDSVKPSDTKNSADASNLAGNLYEDQGNFAMAYEYYYRAMQSYYALGDQRGLAHAVNNVANMYYRKGMYEQALKFQTFALKVRTELKDTTGIASSYNNIGNVYFSWKQYERALRFYNRAIKLKTESGDTLELINIRMNIGSAWLGLKNYELARFHYTEALRLARNENNEVLIADGLINMGYNEFLDGNMDEAGQFYEDARAIADRSGFDFEKMLVMKNYGELSLTTGQFAQAAAYLDTAESLCRQLEIRESLLEILRFRIDLLTRQNKYREAWDIHSEYELLNDSLFSETALQQLNDFQQVQEFEARRREMRIKDLEITLKNSEIQSMRWLLVISLLLLIFGSATLFLLLKARFRKREMEARQRQHAAQQKALSAQMNPHFISNSLSSIQNFFLKNDIASASDYLNRFGKLIRKVLDLSMHDLIPLEDELDILRLYVQLEELRLGKPVRLDVKMPADFPSGSYSVPPLLLQPVVENAIWHGISRHSQPGLIVIEFESDDVMMICRIADNGVGLESEATNQKPRKEKSYGLGLTRERLMLMMPSATQDDLCTVREISGESGTVHGVEVTLKIPLKYV